MMVNWSGGSNLRQAHKPAWRRQPHRLTRQRVSEGSNTIASWFQRLPRFDSRCSAGYPNVISPWASQSSGSDKLIPHHIRHKTTARTSNTHPVPQRAPSAAGSAPPTPHSARPSSVRPAGGARPDTGPSQPCSAQTITTAGAVLIRWYDRVTCRSISLAGTAHRRAGPTRNRSPIARARLSRRDGSVMTANRHGWRLCADGAQRAASSKRCSTLVRAPDDRDSA